MKKTKFYPKESKNDEFYFSVDGIKYRCKQDDIDHYSIKNCETGEEDHFDCALHASFPKSIFPLIKDLKYSQIYDLGNGYKLWWEEDIPFADSFDFIIYNFEKGYAIGSTYNDDMPEEEMINCFLQKAKEYEEKDFNDIYWMFDWM